MWQGGPLKDGTLHPANYGFGWATKFVRGHRMVGHSGGWQGFSTYFARYVDDELSIAVLANLDAAEPGRIVKRIAAAIVPELAPYERIADPDSTLTERLRQVVRSYLSGEVEREAFSDQALSSMLRTLRASRWPDEMGRREPAPGDHRRGISR